MPMAARRWCWRSGFPQPDRKSAIAVFLLGENGVALLARGFGDISARFLATQSNQQNLTCVKAIQSQTGTDKCHGTYVRSDVDCCIV